MINRNKVQIWKSDVAKSADLYNSWFIDYAPNTFVNTRKEVTKEVEESLKSLNDMRSIDADLLYKNPKAVKILRMCIAPPIAIYR